ncbi:hypothetical protein A1A1_16288 [Planococcus antarcticus DSM 14505]|uniref:Uncharacterized protein n=1 Tax=Planococcus antarcticus DSM 14505 TaxID=1185653 RepID=A0AA87LTI1_9BACL|nr:hypothetical protein [Planococcus antarcticus]EIM05415.1 hypothetical protein A1A1_16288 [Planococcus antarcticus DSM 14505]
MLKYYFKRYEVITQGEYPANRKKIMVANLLSEMETTFDIPLQISFQWEQENEEVIALYRQVSADKNL